MANVDIDLNAAEKGALMKKIFEYLAGDDGTLDLEDVDAERIQGMVFQLIQFANQAATEIQGKYKETSPAKEDEGSIDVVEDFVEKVASMSDVSDALSNLSKVRDAAKQLRDGEVLSLDDIMGLAKSFPELMLLIGDMDAMSVKLSELENREIGNIGELVRSWVANDADIAKASPFAEYLSETVTTIQELYDSIPEDADDLGLLQLITQYLDDMAQKATSAAEGMTDFSSSMKLAATGALEGLNAFMQIDEAALKVAHVFEQFEENRAFGSMSDNHYMGAIDYLANQMMDSRLSGEENLLETWNNALLKLDEHGLLQGMFDEFGNFSSIAEENIESIDAIIAKLMELREAAQNMDLTDMAEKLRESREANIASTNDYQQQVSELMASFESGGVSAAMETYNGFLDSIQSGI